jgi:hypothetical protein
MACLFRPSPESPDPVSLKQAGGVKRVVEELAYAFFNDDFRKGKSFLDWLSKQPEFGYQLLKTNGRGKFINPAMPAMLERYQSRGGSRFAASDRTLLIRLASGLPQGDENRRTILSGLQKEASAYQQALKLMEGDIKFLQRRDATQGDIDWPLFEDYVQDILKNLADVLDQFEITNSNQLRSFRIKVKPASHSTFSSNIIPSGPKRRRASEGE